MAMYVFQELSPKVFYFTYCLQEPEKYIQFIEQTEGYSGKDSNLISPWNKFEDDNGLNLYGYEKIITSNFSNNEKPIDNRMLYLVNSLKATFHYCFGQYRLFNNIQEELNLSDTFVVKKYEEKFLHNEQGNGKYTAYMYINDDYEGGNITLSGTKAFVKPEKASIIIAPSNITVTSSPTFNGTRYVAVSEWL